MINLIGRIDVLEFGVLEENSFDERPHNHYVNVPVYRGRNQKPS
jgi:hypothetical protein